MVDAAAAALAIDSSFAWLVDGGGGGADPSGGGGGGGALLPSHLVVFVEVCRKEN